MEGKALNEKEIKAYYKIESKVKEIAEIITYDLNSEPIKRDYFIQLDSELFDPNYFIISLRTHCTSDFIKI